MLQTVQADAPTRAGRFGRAVAWVARPPLWLTFLVCTAILVARRPEALRTPQFWAEDGLILFGHAWTFDWGALLLPYAGYLHTLLRLVAGVSVQFDPAWAPMVFHVGAAAFTLYVAMRTQSRRFPFPPHIGYALAVVLVPDVFEVLLFLVNAQWVLAAGLIVLLVSHDAQRWWQHAHDALAAMLIGLTGPFSVLLAPLFLWRAWQRRTRASAVLAALVVAAAAAQAWTIWKNPIVVAEGPVATEALLAAPGMRIAGSLFAGYRVPLDYPLAVETLLGALTLIGVAALALRGGPARLERAWLAVAFGLILASSLYRCRFVLLDLCHASFGSRYFFPLQLIVIWLVIAAAQDARRWLARTAALALLWMLAINIPRLREPGLTDLHWAEHAAKLRAGEAAVVPIHPGWDVSLPARRK